MRRNLSYFSIACMSIDIRRGVLTYGGAGHPPPVLLRADGVLETLGYHGPVIGFGSESPYGQRELRLEPGDKIILYTDGLTENRGREGRAFGKDMFYSILREFGRSTVEELVGGLHTEMQTFFKRRKARRRHQPAGRGIHRRGGEPLQYMNFPGGRAGKIHFLVLLQHTIKNPSAFARGFFRESQTAG